MWFKWTGVCSSEHKRTNKCSHQSSHNHPGWHVWKKPFFNVFINNHRSPLDYFFWYWLCVFWLNNRVTTGLTLITFDLLRIYSSQSNNRNNRNINLVVTCLLNQNAQIGKPFCNQSDFSKIKHSGCVILQELFQSKKCVKSNSLSINLFFLLNDEPAVSK